MSYINMERAQMRTAFKLLFKVGEEQANSPKLMEWMEQAPIGIVEYEGYLKGETAKSRNARMELMEVYDGEITALVDYLKTLSPEYESMTKWALVFTVYNGIENSEELIKQTSTADNKIVEEDSTDGTSNKSDLSKSAPMVQQSGVEAVPTLEEFVEENGVIVTDEVKEEPKSAVEEQKSEMADVSTSTVEVTGKAEVSSKESLANKLQTNKKMEETKMENQDFLQGANQMGMGENFGEQNPGSAKPVANQNSEFISNAKDQILQSAAARAAYVQNNFVSKVVVPFAPSALRIVDANNGVISAGDVEAAKKAVKKAIDNFGKITGMPIDAYKEDMTPAEKFPYVTDVEERAKAEAVLQLLLKLKNTPDMALPVYVNPNPTYSLKGFKVGDRIMNQADFVADLMLNTTGALYAEGALVDGTPTNEGTSFVLAMTSKSVGKAKKGDKPTTEGSTEKKTVKAGALRVKNKNNFISNADHVIIIYPTIENASPEQMKYTGVKALITVDGKDMAASFRAEAHDKDGKLITVPGGTDSKGNQKEAKTKMATFSLGLRTLTKVTEAVPTAELGMDAEKVEKYFNAKGVSVGSTREEFDFTSAEKFTEATKGTEDKSSALVRLVAAIAAGQTDMVVEGELAGIVNSVKAGAANAEEAKSAADEKDIL